IRCESAVVEFGLELVVLRLRTAVLRSARLVRVLTHDLASPTHYCPLTTLCVAPAPEGEGTRRVEKFRPSARGFRRRTVPGPQWLQPRRRAVPAPARRPNRPPAPRHRCRCAPSTATGPG